MIAPVDTLGPRIKSAREALGLRQSDLAEKVDVSTTTVKNWEAGRTIPKDRIGAIERELRISLRDTGVSALTLVDASVPRILAELAGRVAQLQDTNAALQAERDAAVAAFERLRSRTGQPLGVTASPPEHLLNGPVARNAVADNAAGQAADQTSGTT